MGPEEIRMGGPSQCRLTRSELTSDDLLTLDQIAPRWREVDAPSDDKYLSLDQWAYAWRRFSDPTTTHGMDDLDRTKHGINLESIAQQLANGGAYCRWETLRVLQTPAEVTAAPTGETQATQQRRARQEETLLPLDRKARELYEAIVGPSGKFGSDRSYHLVLLVDDSASMSAASNAVIEALEASAAELERRGVKEIRLTLGSYVEHNFEDPTTKIRYTSEGHPWQVTITIDPGGAWKKAFHLAMLRLTFEGGLASLDRGLQMAQKIFASDPKADKNLLVLTDEAAYRLDAQGHGVETKCTVAKALLAQLARQGEISLIGFGAEVSSRAAQVDDAFVALRLRLYTMAPLYLPNRVDQWQRDLGEDPLCTALIKNIRTIDDLLKTMREDKAASIRRAAIHVALQRTPSDWATIRQLLLDDNPEVYEAARQALPAVATEALSFLLDFVQSKRAGRIQLTPDIARELYVKVAAASGPAGLPALAKLQAIDPSFTTHREIIPHLPGFGPGALGLMHTYLNNPATHTHAIMFLGQFGPPAIPLLTEVQSQLRQPEEILAFAYSIIDLGAEALPVIRPLIERHGGNPGFEGTVHMLLPTLEKTGEAGRTLIHGWLEREDLEAVHGPLLEAYAHLGGDPWPYVRRWWNGFGSLGGKMEVSANTAYRVLKIIDANPTISPEGMVLLEALAHHSNAEVRCDTAYILARLGNEGKALLEAMAHQSPPDVRCIVHGLLATGAASIPTIAGIIRRLSVDERSRNVQYLEENLTHFPTVVEPLLQQLANDPDPLNRDYVAHVLKRFSTKRRETSPEPRAPDTTTHRSAKKKPVLPPTEEPAACEYIHAMMKW